MKKRAMIAMKKIRLKSKTVNGSSNPVKVKHQTKYCRRRCFSPMSQANEASQQVK
jgi:hypothetical protein